jgi:dihydroorotase-like cyclic amidohydrolase
VIDPGAAWTVDPAEFLSMGKATPFTAKAVRSRIVLTLKDGVPVYQSPSL